MRDHLSDFFWIFLLVSKGWVTIDAIVGHSDRHLWPISVSADKDGEKNGNKMKETNAENKCLPYMIGWQTEYWQSVGIRSQMIFQLSETKLSVKCIVCMHSVIIGTNFEI